MTGPEQATARHRRLMTPQYIAFSDLCYATMRNVHKARNNAPSGEKSVKCREGEEWCLEADSNHRHVDFQSTALPTELPRRAFFFAGAGSISEPIRGVQQVSPVFFNLLVLTVKRGVIRGFVVPNRDGVSPGEPHAQIHIGAAARAERTIDGVGRMPLADRTGRHGQPSVMSGSPGRTPGSGISPALGPSCSTRGAAREASSGAHRAVKRGCVVSDSTAWRRRRTTARARV